MVLHRPIETTALIRHKTSPTPFSNAGLDSELAISAALFGDATRW